MSDMTGILDALQSIAKLKGARGGLIATGDGAFSDGRHSTLEMTVANDVAKTVRRMVVASTTVGAPLEELVINLGAARMMVTPIDDDATLVVLLDRDTASRPMRDALAPIMETLRGFNSPGDVSGGSAVHPPPSAFDGDDEIAELVGGELGPALHKIENSFAGSVRRIGGDSMRAADVMREQLREWLLCCNPSPYTLPLLLDGLSQTLNEDPQVRIEFMNEMQQILKDSGVWQGTSA
jgi:predicted regulator of Ras-like GTPase activity (Roadblock/LC7/MglB family)